MALTCDEITALTSSDRRAAPANGLKDPRDVILDLVEGGLLLLLDAVKAGDPKDEIIWRIEEELRQVRRRS